MRERPTIIPLWYAPAAPAVREQVPLPIARSWQACRARGLSPHTWRAPLLRDVAPDPVLTPLRPVLEDLYEFLEGTSSAAALWTPDAWLIELVGDDDICAWLTRLGLRPGSQWSEEQIGTNALALALQEGHPLATIGLEHYYAALHDLALAAAPLFGPDGSLLGAVGLVTRAEAFQAHTLALVAAAAQGIQTRWQLETLIAEANHHLTELNAAIETMSEGVLLISIDDRIARLNRRVEQILGISARAAAGRPLREVLTLPEPLQCALTRRTALTDQELLFETPRGTVAVVCGLKPILRHGQYLGALLTLQPPERLRRLVHQVVGARAQVSFRDIIGESAAIQPALRQARIAAQGATHVLIIGEHGTGKELFAHAIHQASARAAGPLVTLNCATIPRTLIGVELFGSERSADGQARGRPGKLELADGGTLLLKAVDALPMEQQTALLRVIETRATMRLGSRRVVPLDVRIIATTTTALDVAGGHFRPDLAARLGMLTIELPPLRARDSDVLLFIEQILSALNQRLGKQVVLTPEALQVLQRYPWPGNVRELETVLEQLVHRSEHSVITPADLPAALQQWQAGRGVGQLQRHYNQIERETILRVGRAMGGHLTRTAQQLGISRTTLWRKMQEHGLRRSDFWPDDR
ncbi:sigma-54-dependent Fis family transcriptional regulator [Kallotenue papyrolyticum]|uniref:sigma-54-dependent Fis family transcriptional regulator n=1 Tax=Kallotenue papyrolyticum TaxID=1325125 RepID=UPI0004785471|nr:sigma-54-dependent Fis family transcriptional regulator [Kallotenue papyrolyticum]